MKSATLSVKVDPETKRQAQKLADDLGISLGTLVSVLLKEVIRTGELHLKARGQVSVERIENDDAQTI